MIPLSHTKRIFIIPSPHEARKAIIMRIADSFVGFPNWYIGIASDPDTRLFIDHKVDKESFWIYKDAGSEEAARTIAKFIIDTYGAKGNVGKEDKTAHYVYAYAITEKNRNNIKIDSSGPVAETRH